MSTATTTKTTKGIRYSDAQKQEVIDFANAYNAENGRGGQSKAAEKFNISQITISSWLKSSGGSSKKSARAKKGSSKKASKSSKASQGAKGTRRSRYSDEQKQEVVDFVVAYNSANGRGGPSLATKKFGVSPLTVGAWLKAAGASSGSQRGVRGTKKAAKKSSGRRANAGSGKQEKNSASTGGYGSRLGALVSLGNQIDQAESELSKLKEKFNSMVSSL